MSKIFEIRPIIYTVDDIDKLEYNIRMYERHDMPVAAKRELNKLIGVLDRSIRSRHCA